MHPVPTRRALLSTLAAVATLTLASNSLACPYDNQDVLGPCGPQFSLPNWTSAQWKDPSYYSTIQAGDLDGDGAAELIGRSPLGVEIYRFSKEWGQWRPYLDANNVFVLTGFSDTGDWNQPQYYSTIQIADIDGNGAAEILARGAQGIEVFGFDGDRGIWTQVTDQGPLPDAVNGQATGWDRPEYYSTIQFADIDGDGAAELLARGAGGMAIWRWSGIGWSQVPLLWQPFADDVPRTPWYQSWYYQSIQTADLNGDGVAELLGRGSQGIEVYRYVQQGAVGLWESFGQTYADLGALTWFSDVGGWGNSAYFSTIQAADIDGDGAEEILGRGAGGMVVFKYNQTTSLFSQVATQGPFADNGTWNTASHYLSIQTADIDGDGRADLLGRNSDGIHLYRWVTGSGWVEDTAVSATPRLTDSYSGTAYGSPQTFSLWDQPWNNETIQTADIDGDQRAELLARGDFGMRTWRFTPGTGGSGDAWAPYLAYGFSEFNTPALDAAYGALNRYLEPGTPGFDLRKGYANGHPGPYPGLIDATCRQDTSNPPRYTQCTPPPGANGVTAADWLAVAQTIRDELRDTAPVAAYLNDMGTLHASVYNDLHDQYTTIATNLQLSDLAQTTASVNQLSLWSNIFKVVTTLTGYLPEAKQFTFALNLVANAMSVAASASPSGSSGDSFQATYDQATAELDANMETAGDALDNLPSYILNDPNLLAAVGELVDKVWPTINIDISADYINGYKSSTRQAFAIWAYQQFLPVLWDFYSITGCANQYLLTCAPPANGSYLSAYSDDGTRFAGLLPNGNPCAVDPSQQGTHCDFTAVPSAAITTILWGVQDPTCLPTPGSGRVWEFSGCTLGLPTGPDSDIFNNRYGWNFTQVTGDPAPGTSAVEGQVPVGPTRPTGFLRASTSAWVPPTLDLRKVRVSLGAVLEEEGGGELALRGSLTPAAVPPDTPLVPRGVRKDTGLFVSPAGGVPNVVVRLLVQAGKLQADLTASGIGAREPDDCAGATPKTELMTRLTVQDGTNPPISLRALDRWNCATLPSGARTLVNAAD